MSLDHLWAAWRQTYVESVPTDLSALSGVEFEEGHGPECVFCSILSEDATEQDRLIVASNEHSVAILNAFPYTSGHLLVMPVRHVSELTLLKVDEFGSLFEMIRASTIAMEKAYGPDGLNIGANLGRAAGAGIPGHLHFHVLCRWIGDTNFMTTVAGVRVMPEALGDSWAKLCESWPK